MIFRADSLAAARLKVLRAAVTRYRPGHLKTAI